MLGSSSLWTQGERPPRTPVPAHVLAEFSGGLGCSRGRPLGRAPLKQKAALPGFGVRNTSPQGDDKPLPPHLGVQACLLPGTHLLLPTPAPGSVSCSLSSLRSSDSPDQLSPYPHHPSGLLGPLRPRSHLLCLGRGHSEISLTRRAHSHSPWVLSAAPSTTCGQGPHPGDRLGLWPDRWRAGLGGGLASKGFRLRRPFIAASVPR